MKFLRTLWMDDEGQDMVEYALIAGLISVVAYVAVTAAGGDVNTIWSTVRHLDAAASAAAVVCWMGPVAWPAPLLLPVTKEGRKEQRKMTTLNRLWQDDEGQDLVEYALIAALLSLASYLALGSFWRLARHYVERRQYRFCRAAAGV